MEYIDGGMLMNYVKSDERFVSKGMVQILRAVDYLHRNQIAHRDIKP
jgi:serine/threonine protein kinase